MEARDWAFALGTLLLIVVLLVTTMGRGGWIGLADITAIFIIVLLAVFVRAFAMSGLFGFGKKKDKICPGCGQHIPVDSQFCPHDGYSFTIRSCTKCGSQNPPNNKHCSNCGEKLV